MGDPRDVSFVEDCVFPAADSHGEGICGDAFDVGVEAPVDGFAEVHAGDPGDHFWGLVERTGEFSY